MMSFTRCFPHIVNLACKAVLVALEETNYVQTEDEFEAFHSDPVANLRSLIRAVCLVFSQSRYFHINVS